MYLPDVDNVCDYHVPDIDAQYVVYWQDNGEIYVETFTVFEDNAEAVFAKALEFAQKHDTLLFCQEVGATFFDPQTGKPVETPIDTLMCKHYYDQPTQPYEYSKWGFTAVDSDELPF